MEHFSNNHASLRISCPINPYVINCMVEKEKLRVRENCSFKEEQFIGQMLLENPIAIEKCNDGYYEPSGLNNDENESKDIVADGTVSEKEQSYKLLDSQHSEMCHYEQSNVKKRKAHTSYRHQYMKYRLKESHELLTNLQDVIGKSEAKLIAQGFPKQTLEFLRRQYGVDKAVQKVYTGSIHRTIKRNNNHQLPYSKLS